MNKIILLLIRIYQIAISPLLGQNCKFYPSCSNYSIEAFKKYNFFKASYLTVKRLLKCNPLSDGGIDELK